MMFACSSSAGYADMIFVYRISGAATLKLWQPSYSHYDYGNKLDVVM